MVIRHFLNWIGNARVSERVAAAGALGRAFLENDLSFEERCEVEAALTLLLDDPSARVRQELAEVLSISSRAPLQIIMALAGDQQDVAAPVLVRSPLLTDLDLIDRVAEACGEVQALIAARPFVSMAVSAAIAEVGSADACIELVRNDGADIASLSFRRMAERLGDNGTLRAALLADRRLPSDCRHLLLVKLGDALGRSRLMVSLMGAERAGRVTREACAKASISLIDDTRPQEHPALVEHLRLRGDLTAAFIVRAMAHGKVDFLAAVLVCLTGQSEARIRSLLGGGSDHSLRALMRQAGLATELHAVMICALRMWREVATGRHIAGVQEVSWAMLDAAGAPASANRELVTLLRKIHLDALRSNARSHARAIAAA